MSNLMNNYLQQPNKTLTGGVAANFFPYCVVFSGTPTSPDNGGACTICLGLSVMTETATGAPPQSGVENSYSESQYLASNSQSDTESSVWTRGAGNKLLFTWVNT